jgi:hypothetical protein
VRGVGRKKKGQREEMAQTTYARMNKWIKNKINKLHNSLMGMGGFFQWIIVLCNALPTHKISRFWQYSLRKLRTTTLDTQRYIHAHTKKNKKCLISVSS